MEKEVKPTAPKVVEVKKTKSKTVDFRVKLKFNGYKRGQIVKNVDRETANKWVSKERGEIIEK